MASREELNNLRSEVRKRRSAVTRKLNRLAKQGVDVQHVPDPRRAPEVVARYTKLQLKNYQADLNIFMDRRVQYVAGARGTPLPGNRVHELQAKLKRINKQTHSEFEQIKDLKIPSMGNMTIGEIQALKTPDHPTMGNPASRAPHWPIKKDPSGIPNAKQLEKNIAEINAKLTPGFRTHQLNAQRWAAYKMMDQIGKHHMGKMLAGLSDKEFNVLWNYTTFAEAEVLYYEKVKDRMQEKSTMAWYDNIIDNETEKMLNFINEVKDLRL